MEVFDGGFRTLVIMTARLLFLLRSYENRWYRIQDLRALETVRHGQVWGRQFR